MADTKLDLKQIPVEFIRVISGLLSEEPDATLSVGDVEIKVHKALLSAYSPVFKAMFDKKFNDEYEIDRDPVVFGKFIDMLYFRNAAAMTLDHELELLDLLDYYHIDCFIKPLTESVMKKITLDTVYDIWKRLKSEESKKICRDALWAYLSKSGTDRSVISKIKSADDMYDILVHMAKSPDPTRHWYVTECIIFWYDAHKSVEGRAKLATLVDPNKLRIGNIWKAFKASLIDRDVFVVHMMNAIDKNLVRFFDDTRSA
jgi:hypothetical protein